MRVPKTHRQRLIAKLLAGQSVTSQEQLRSMLHEAGVRATQGTLSRDLRELGVVKTAAGYALGPVNGQVRRSNSDLESALEQYMLSVEPAGMLVVVKTDPGHASALASQIDLSALTGVVGSVAGDDTIFLATRSPRDARSVSMHLQKLGGIL